MSKSSPVSCALRRPSSTRRGIAGLLASLPSLGWAAGFTIDANTLLINGSTQINGSSFVALRRDPGVVEFLFKDSLVFAPGDKVNAIGPYAVVLYSARDVVIGAATSFNVSANGLLPGPGGGYGGYGYGGSPSYAGGSGGGGGGGGSGSSATGLFSYNPATSGGVGGTGHGGNGGSAGVGYAGQAGFNGPGAAAPAGPAGRAGAGALAGSAPRPAGRVAA